MIPTYSFGLVITCYYPLAMIEVRYYCHSRSGSHRYCVVHSQRLYCLLNFGTISLTLPMPTVPQSRREEHLDLVVHNQRQHCFALLALFSRRSNLELAGMTVNYCHQRNLVIQKHGPSSQNRFACFY